MADARLHTALLKGKTAQPHDSRGERIADAVLHIAGVIAALVAVPVMVTLAAVWYGDASTVGAGGDLRGRPDRHADLLGLLSYGAARAR